MTQSQLKWVRSPDGAIAGVCKGLSESLDLNLGMFRLIWIASVLFMGCGGLLYIILAFSLPRTDRVELALKKKFLGVCWRIAKKTQIEIGIVRALCLFLALTSLGTSLFVYLLLALILPTTDESELKASIPSDF